MENSDILSLFGGSNNIDILSTVSDAVILTGDGTGGDSKYKGRYFYLGNLLIQFSDFSGDLPNSVNKTSGGSDVSIKFPISYDSKPFSVILTPTKSGTSDNFYITLRKITKTGFEYSIGQNKGNTGFIAIGPRPSS